jgi:hypothetical protein
MHANCCKRAASARPMELESPCILHLMATAAAAATTADAITLNNADAAFRHIAAAAGAEQIIVSVGLLSAATVIDAVCHLLQPIFDGMQLPFMLAAASQAVRMEERLTQQMSLSASPAANVTVQPQLLGVVHQVPAVSVQPASPLLQSAPAAAANSDDRSALASSPGGEQSMKTEHIDLQSVAAAAAAAVISTSAGHTSTLGKRPFKSTWTRANPDAQDAPASSSSSAGVEPVAKARRLPIPWSNSEELDLVRGVERCGPGKWADIKRYYFTNRKPERTQVDIKDKWRSLCNNSLHLKGLKKKL